MTSPLLLAQGLRKQVGERRLWQGITLELGAGERLALVGPAGCGKTLLLRQLAWLDPLEGGQVRLLGLPPQAWSLPRYRAQVAYLAQRPQVFAGTVAQNLDEPWTYRCHQGRSRQPQRLLAWLEQLGREPTFLGQDAGRLSGGETQLLALLRLLQLDPVVLLLDEPTASLDGATSLTLEALLLQWLRGGERALILTSHDPAQVERCCDRQLALGRWV
jgi:putative ABC transport system ATP-binding protein